MTGSATRLSRIDRFWTVTLGVDGRVFCGERRLAKPDLDFRVFCRIRRMPGSTPVQAEPAWDAWQAERYRGKTGQQPACTGNPFRGR